MKSEHQAVENSTSKPFMAVVFHKLSNQVIGATRHEITDGKMQTGSYISPVQASELFLSQTTKKNATSASLIPATILVDNSRLLIWYKPSSEKMMWYRVNSNVENFPVKWPPLLFIADKKSTKLSVFGLDSDERPTNDSNVYHAPLMNIYATGVVCQGNAKLPEAITIDTIGLIESTIFDSNFTHVNHTKTLAGKNKDSDFSTLDLLKFWRNLSKTAGKIQASDMVKVNSIERLFSGL